MEEQLYTVSTFWVVNYDGNKAEHMQSGAMMLVCWYVPRHFC